MDATGEVIEQIWEPNVRFFNFNYFVVLNPPSLVLKILKTVELNADQPKEKQTTIKSPERVSSRGSDGKFGNAEILGLAGFWFFLFLPAVVLFVFNVIFCFFADANATLIGWAKTLILSLTPCSGRSINVLNFVFWTNNINVQCLKYKVTKTSSI